MRRRWLRSASSPPHLLGVSEFRLLQAWIDAYLHHLGAPLQEVVTEDGRRIWVNPAAEAEYQSAVLRALAEEAGEFSVDRLPVPEQLRPLFALPNPQGIHAILGHWEDDVWHPGLAGLSDRECEALWLYMHDLKLKDIRDTMDRRRGRFGLPLALATVESYLARARGKLLRLFEFDPWES